MVRIDESSGLDVSTLSDRLHSSQIRARPKPGVTEEYSQASQHTHAVEDDQPHAQAFAHRRPFPLTESVQLHKRPLEALASPSTATVSSAAGPDICRQVTSSPSNPKEHFLEPCEKPLLPETQPFQITPSGLLHNGSTSAFPGQWSYLLHVYSYRQLFSPVSAKMPPQDYGINDKVVFMPGFSRRAYVANSVATRQDFSQYFNLIKFAEEGMWYAVLPAQRHASVQAQQWAGQPARPQFVAVVGSDPASQEIPWVTNSMALRTSPVATSPPHDANVMHADSLISCANLKNGPYLHTSGRADQHDEASDLHRWHSAGVQRGIRKSTELTYICIVRTFQASRQKLPGNYPSNETTVSAGTEIFRVRRLDSRNAAATQAFYDAGANGWSIVFSCVVRSDLDWSLISVSDFERSDTIWQLSETGRRPQIFF